MTMFAFLRHQIEDPNSEAYPCPNFTGLRMTLLNIVAEVFHHRRPLFSQGQGQPLIEVVVRGDTVCNGLGFCEKNVAGYFVIIISSIWMTDMKTSDSKRCALSHRQ